MNHSSRVSAEFLPRIGLFVVALVWSTIVAGAPLHASVPVPLALDLAGWSTRSFHRETRYEVSTDSAGVLVCGRSDGAASGLYRRMRVDLDRTPVLTWRWRVDRQVNGADETTGSGDDFAARVYMVVEHPVVPWRARAISYVWSRAQPRGAVWTNPHSDRSMMVALRNGDDVQGRWYEERRDVGADLARLWGEKIQFLDVVGLMTDADNTESHAEGCYRDLEFRAR